MKLDEHKLEIFFLKSNAIEGIFGQPVNAQISLFSMATRHQDLTVEDVVTFVNISQAGAKLRSSVGLDMVVSNHNPPSGGPGIVSELADIMLEVTEAVNPYDIHMEYESLHPFTDCNGRSGRFIWLWQMVTQHNWTMEIDFLHQFYYQTLNKYNTLSEEA